MLSTRRLTNSLALALGDALALVIAFVPSQLARWSMGLELRFPSWLLLTLALWWLAAGGIGLLAGWGLGIVRELRRITLVLPMVIALSVSLVYTSRPRGESTRLELASTLVLGLFLIPYVRTKVKYLLIRLDLWGISTAIFGDPAAAGPVLAALRREPGLGYRPIAVCGPSEHDAIHGTPIVDRDDPLLTDATIALVVTESSAEWIPRSLARRLKSYRHVLVVPWMGGAPSLWIEPRDLGGLLGLEISQNLADPWSRTLKRLFEVVAVVATAPVWLPLIGALAVTVRWRDRHDPFFDHTRIGRNGQAFRMWKLRTMRTDADEALAERLENDQEAQRRWATSFKLSDDPRITPLGRLLRRSSLDELPQLWNVLRGEMSLVGPRPLPAEHHARIGDDARELRESVRPGITGLWQVSGRGDLDLEGLASSDGYYVRNWSIWLDLVILVRTWRAVSSRAGAY